MLITFVWNSFPCTQRFRFCLGTLSSQCFFYSLVFLLFDLFESIDHIISFLHHSHVQLTLEPYGLLLLCFTFLHLLVMSLNFLDYFRLLKFKFLQIPLYLLLSLRFLGGLFFADDFPCLLLFSLILINTLKSFLLLFLFRLHQFVSWAIHGLSNFLVMLKA